MSGTEQTNKERQAERERTAHTVGAAGPSFGHQHDQSDSDDRTGKYGGDDGALEHETGTPHPSEATGSRVEPERKTGN